MKDKVLLGFEVGTGKEVYMEVHHLVVTGQTQKSGKTTLIEGLIARSDVKAIVFKTKRGEAGFRNYHEIPLYFKESTGWQYYESILEATLGEKMKFNRPWLMRAASGALTIKAVWTNIKRLYDETRGGFAKDQYYVLDEYFKIVVPEIERYTFSTTLELEQGINVMDLTGMKTETQSLIIQSVINYVHDHLRDITVVIPEAWKFVPQSLGNPVKRAAATLIREGAAIQNYLWVDSQTITSIDKEILKQCNNWIMGLQLEVNEVNRTKEQTGRRISDREVMALKLGHFYAYLGDVVYLVYALPAWLDPELGRRVALGELTVEDVRKYAPQEKGDEDETMYKQRFEQLQEKFDNTRVETEKRIKDIQEEADRRIAAAAPTQELEDVIDFAAKGLEIKDRVIDELHEEIKGYKKIVTTCAQVASGLRTFIEMGSPSPDHEVSEAVVEAIVERKLRGMAAKGKPIPTGKGTGIPWVDVIMDKLEPRQQRIMRLVIEKRPLELNVPQICQLLGLKPQGGNIGRVSKDLRGLVEWLLLERRGDAYVLARSPP